MRGNRAGADCQKESNESDHWKFETSGFMGLNDAHSTSGKVLADAIRTRCGLIPAPTLEFVVLSKAMVFLPESG